MAMTEQQWGNVSRLFHRIVDHDWQDRALGTYAPKMSETDTKAPNKRKTGRPRTYQAIEVGDRFGSRVVVAILELNKHRQRRIEVLCDCGNRSTCPAPTVRNTKGCRNCSQRRRGAENG